MVVGQEIPSSSSRPKSYRFPLDGEYNEKGIAGTGRGSGFVPGSFRPAWNKNAVGYLPSLGGSSRPLGFPTNPLFEPSQYPAAAAGFFDPLAARRRMLELYHSQQDYEGLLLRARGNVATVAAPAAPLHDYLLLNQQRRELAYRAQMEEEERRGEANRFRQSATARSEARRKDDSRSHSTRRGQAGNSTRARTPAEDQQESSEEETGGAKTGIIELPENGKPAGSTLLDGRGGKSASSSVAFGSAAAAAAAAAGVFGRRIDPAIDLQLGGGRVLPGDVGNAAALTRAFPTHRQFVVPGRGITAMPSYYFLPPRDAMSSSAGFTAFSQSRMMQVPYEAAAPAGVDYSGRGLGMGGEVFRVGAESGNQQMFTATNNASADSKKATQHADAHAASSEQRSRVLYVKGDEQYLTEYQCLLRKQLEMFEAGPNDLRGSTQGRNIPILLGQVGLRCRHCAKLPLAARTKGAVYYSQTIEGYVRRLP